MERKIKFDDRRFIKLWHLFYYFPRNSMWDNNAQLILDFKRDIRSAGDYLLQCMLRELRGHQLNEEIIVIRALKSSELKVGTGTANALDYLGQGIATGISGIYIPQLLIKTRVNSPLKELRAREREKELEGVYNLKDLGLNLENRQIILVDDVVTTGATSRAIVGTILNRFPTAKINTVALGWTPTSNQQQLLLDQQRTDLMLHEPIPSYGNRLIGRYDDDYEQGETFVKL